ncbi:MAG: DNA polymerase IV [Spirochaetota bacterium]|nr:DNA polymerase IV [Spirochaetota bacterium]
MDNENYFNRKIIHIDMDAFYASVEQRDNPGLKGKCVIVGGDPNSRGVVCAASYEARKYGIRSAMASSTAFRLCPHAIFIKPNFEKYKMVSTLLINIFTEYTDLIEPLSLDEAYLDVTNNKLNIPSATQIAKEIKNRIFLELNLTASCGVAPNKLIAKIASEHNKPNGLCIVKPSQIPNFLINMDLIKIPGVGKKTQKKLESLGFIKCKDILNQSRANLIHLFGRFGDQLYDFVRGIDPRPVKTSRIRKSIACEVTLKEDLLETNEIKNIISQETNNIVQILNKKELTARTITLKIKYYDFTAITRSITLPYSTTKYNEIRSSCFNLLNKTLVGSKKVRLVGVSVSKLSNKIESSDQLTLNFNQQLTL